MAGPPALQEQLAAAPAVLAFVLRTAQCLALACPASTCGILRIAESLICSVPDLDPLAHLTAKLLVDPLHPWPPGSWMRPASGEEEADMAAHLEQEAVRFLCTAMERPDIVAQVAAVPGFWEALAVLYRRKRAASEALSEELACPMLIVGKLLQVGHAGLPNLSPCLNFYPVAPGTCAAARLKLCLLITHRPIHPPPAAAPGPQAPSRGPDHRRCYRVPVH